LCRYGESPAGGRWPGRRGGAVPGRVPGAGVTARDVRQLISLRATELLCNDELYRYLFNYTGYPFGRMERRHRQGAANPRMWDAVQLTDTLLVGMLEAAPDAEVCVDAEVMGARS
jgi:hypothetical protein